MAGVDLGYKLVMRGFVFSKAHYWSSFTTVASCH